MLAATVQHLTDWLERHLGHSNPDVVSRGWRSLWRVQVPGKTRHLPWQLGRQEATDRMFARQGIWLPRTRVRCVACWTRGNTHQWNARHLAASERSQLRILWIIQFPRGRPRRINGFFCLIKSMNHDELTLWVIWHARRKSVHEDQHQSPLSMHVFVQIFIKELKGVSFLAPLNSVKAGSRQHEIIDQLPQGLIYRRTVILLSQGSLGRRRELHVITKEHI